MFQTVCGIKDPESLGHSQIHEHVFLHSTPMTLKNPALRIDNKERSLEELISYKNAGGTFLTDAQPVAAGRDAEILQRLSMESGVSIVASTGYHLLDFYSSDSWIHSLCEDGLYELFCEELKEGMLPWLPDPSVRPLTRTAVRAGMVKAAIPAPGATGRYKTLLRAAARAAVRCGVPLMLHTERGENTLSALDIIFKMGLSPEKTVVCHVDRQADDVEAHKSIAVTGVFLDYDTVGRFKYHSDEEEISLLRHMADCGYTQNILLSLDTTAERLSSYGGKIGLCYLLDIFLPRLKGEGFTQTEISAFSVDNCRRLWT